MVKTGDHVLYRGSDYKGPATVLHARARDGKDPLVTLAFVDPKRTEVLAQPNWRNAFDRRFDIQSDTDAPEGQAHYARTFQVPFVDMLELSVAIIDGGGTDLVISPDAVVQSAKILIDRLAEKLFHANEYIKQLGSAQTSASSPLPKVTTIGQEFLPDPLPSAADLDAVAAEQKVVEETQ